MSTLLALPTEILSQICLTLPLPRDTKSLASTCRVLRDKLTIPSNYLWFTFLKTLPTLRHQTRSFYKPFIDNPPPVCVVSGKFDFRVNYYGRALSILRGRVYACFDCFNLNKRSLRRVYIGNIYYRTYCASCYERYFWLIEDFRVDWPEIEVPPSIIANEPGTRLGAIHYNDAIFLIRDQLPPRARSVNGRFISKWNQHVLMRKGRYPGVNESFWKEIDPRMMTGTQMDGIIKTMVWIYANTNTFKNFWPLGGKEKLREYLEKGALDFLDILSSTTLRLARLDHNRTIGPGGLLWTLAGVALKADSEHVGENSWGNVEGGRKGYLEGVCEEYMMELFGKGVGGKQKVCRLLNDWIGWYTCERVGMGKHEHKYRPYFCQFCKEEKPGEKVDWDGSYASSRTLDPLAHMSGLVTHIFTRHNERFEERWVTGGGVVEPMGKKWEPVWKNLRALDASMSSYRETSSGSDETTYLSLTLL
ncbi:hypothetical protein TWF281_001366 [Arthrobotrys megalospora]